MKDNNDELKSRIAFLIELYGRDAFTEVVEEVLNLYQARLNQESGCWQLLLLPKHYDFAIDAHLKPTPQQVEQ